MAASDNNVVQHRWGGVIADAEGYVRLSAAAASGGWERRRRTTRAAGGGGDYDLVFDCFVRVGRRGSKQRRGFSSYVTCIVFLSETSHNLLATC